LCREGWKSHAVRHYAVKINLWQRQNYYTKTLNYPTDNMNTGSYVTKNVQCTMF